MASEPVISFLETFDAGCDTLDVNIDNNEMFISGGIMNPKELYLTGEECHGVQVKDTASSSDSGISAFDDFQDIANVTDLNCLIDADLKDLDFGIDFSVAKVDRDDVFDPGVIVKQEPSSPSSDSSSGQASDSNFDATVCLQPVSPEFYNFHGDITIKEECTPEQHILQQQYLHQQQLHHHHQQQQQQQQESSPHHNQLSDVFSTEFHPLHQDQHHGASPGVQYSPQPGYFVPSPPTQLQPHVSPTIVPGGSPSSTKSSSASSYQPLLSLIHTTQQQQQRQLQQQQQKTFKFSPNSSPTPGQHHGYVIVTSSSSSPSASSPSSSSSSSSSGASKKKIILSNAGGGPGVKRASVVTTQPAPPAVLKLTTIAPGDGGMSPSAGTGVLSPLTTVSPSSHQIDAILNSNIRIQPKLGAEVKVSAGNLQWVSGVDSTTGQQAIPVATQHGIPIITSSASITTITDEKSLKRAQRIIKNRESACLSRKRKKEYMSSLEERLQQCASDNERLLRENEALRRQVQSLQRENCDLKLPKGSSPAKKVCLMCVALLLTLNLSSLSLFGGPSSVSQPASMGITHSAAGRSLLSLSDEMLSSRLDSNYRGGGNNGSGLGGKSDWTRFLDTGSRLKFDHELGLLAQRMNMTHRLGHMCPMYFNSTESLRLAEQLRGWMISQEEEKKRSKKRRSSRQTGSSQGLQQERRQRQGDKHSRKKDYPALRRLGAHLYSEDNVGRPPLVHSGSAGVRERMAAGAAGTATGRYPVQVFGGGFDPREQLLDAIPRRNDTFYVLSFSTDYFLVPATAHNKTMRPRMSLLMPVVSSSLNGSQTHGNADQVGMMQIDCEILNTNLIHVRRSAFPDTDPASAPNSTAFQFEQQRKTEPFQHNVSSSSGSDKPRQATNKYSGSSNSSRHQSGNNRNSNNIRPQNNSSGDSSEKTSTNSNGGSNVTDGSKESKFKDPRTKLNRG